MSNTGEHSDLSPKLRFSTLFLVGMPGAGKSTVGPVLGDRLGWSFQDTDLWIEKTSGKSAQQWIQLNGEPELRRRELQAIQELTLQPRQVIALGGGAFAEKQVQDWVIPRGIVVYLQAQSDTLVDRLKGQLKNRPLVSTAHGEIDFEALHRLLEARRVHYEKADFWVDTDSGTPSEIAQLIHQRIWLGEDL